MADNLDKITNYVKPWHPLTELPAEAVPDNKANNSNDEKLTSTRQETAQLDKNQMKLLWDIITYMFSIASIRIKRLNLSGRAFEQAKNQSLDMGLLRESKAGMSTYLIPLQKAYDTLAVEGKELSEHRFYTELLRHYIQKDPRNKSVRVEVALCDKTGIADLLVTSTSGHIKAYELTLSTTNLVTNVQKYAKLPYKIIFVCRDYRLKQAVRLCIREANLPAELASRVSYMHIHELVQRYKKMS